MLEHIQRQIPFQRPKAMNICGTPELYASRPLKSDPRAQFRAELSTLKSWQEKSRRIEEKLRQTGTALAARNEKLLALRSDFDALTLDFWRGFGRTLGCEDPLGTIAAQKARMRSVCHIGTILLVVIVTVLAAFFYQRSEGILSVVIIVIGAVVISSIIADPLVRIARARRVAAILGREQKPFWLTGGRVALSNLGITPPVGAHWWTAERITFVFTQHLAARFTIDAFTGSLIWEGPAAQTETRLCASLASQLVKDLLSRPWYRQLVNAFDLLSRLEEDFDDLQNLKAEADQGLAQEQAEAQKRAALDAEKARQRAAEASRTHSDGRVREQKSLAASRSPQGPPGTR